VENAAEFKFRTYAENSPVTMWGVLFRRTDGTGHCVVLEHGEFRDYQPDPVQTIVGGDADQIEAQIVYVFSISEHAVTEAPTEGSGAGESEGGDGGDSRSPKEVEMNEPAEEEPQDEEMEDGTN
jgi:hypothetical protein